MAMYNVSARLQVKLATPSLCSIYWSGVLFMQHLHYLPQYTQARYTYNILIILCTSNSPIYMYR